jgi:hypothetical protein
MDKGARSRCELRPVGDAAITYETVNGAALGKSMDYVISNDDPSIRNRYQGGTRAVAEEFVVRHARCNAKPPAYLRFVDDSTKEYAAPAVTFTIRDIGGGGDAR